MNVLVCDDVGVLVSVVEVVAVVVGEMVCVVVCELLGVVVSVMVSVVVVVGVLVCDVVVVGVVVSVLVIVVVWLVVGVVTSHCWKPPASNASVMLFKVAAAASQSSES